MMQPIKTIFFGTSEFAVPALEALRNNARFEIVGVVTQPIVRPDAKRSSRRRP